MSFLPDRIDKRHRDARIRDSQFFLTVMAVACESALAGISESPVKLTAFQQDYIVRPMSRTPDVLYMKRVLRLARKGRGLTSPNPMVGALVVREGKVVGEGYHHAAGEPHAEVLALEEAGIQAVGATIYTNLEPCCHTKKRTPPCTEAIIKSGIRHVVSAMKDPNPMVYGKGFERLRNAGIEVVDELLFSEAEALNEAFIKHKTTGRPFVTLKAAMTLDGRISTASGESRWISGEKSRAEVDHLRAEVDAVLVGIGTVLVDNPMLKLRKVKGKNPLRIVVDPQLQIPMDFNLISNLESSATLILSTDGASAEKVQALRDQGITVLSLPNEGGMIAFESILNCLGKRGLTSLLIEGGAGVNGIALRSGLVDRVIFYIAPKFFCGDDAKAVVGGEAIASLSSALALENVKVKRLGEDIRIEGRIRK